MDARVDTGTFCPSAPISPFFVRLLPTATFPLFIPTVATFEQYSSLISCAAFDLRPVARAATLAEMVSIIYGERPRIVAEGRAAVW